MANKPTKRAKHCTSRKTETALEKAGFAAVKGMAAAKSLELAGFDAEGFGGIEPLLPANLINMNAFSTPWRRSGAALFKRCRQLAYEGENDWVDGVLRIKKSYYCQGFRTMRPDGRPLEVDQPLSVLLRQLSEDAWSEWLACDAAVAFWWKPSAGEGFPSVTILDCEDVKYTNVLGIEKLEVTPKKTKLDDRTKEQLGERWAKAISEGTALTLDREKGECWRVLKRGKSSSGLGVPRMKSILELLSQRELLKLSDWAGAWLSKDVIRQIRKGHEITAGPNAGQPSYFLTKKQLDRIKDQSKNKGGAYTVITNFDLLYAYVYLDPKFFDPEKYKGVREMLTAWAGSVELMRQAGQISPYLVKMFEQEGASERELIASFIEGIIHDPDFVGDGKAKVPEGLRVGWNPHAFKNQAEICEWVRAGANGAVSPQSQREALGVEDEAESALMQEAHQRRMDFTPPFEPRQGLLEENRGGRPADPKNPPPPQAE